MESLLRAIDLFFRLQLRSVVPETAGVLLSPRQKQKFQLASYAGANTIARTFFAFMSAFWYHLFVCQVIVDVRQRNHNMAKYTIYIPVRLLLAGERAGSKRCA